MKDMGGLMEEYMQRDSRIAPTYGSFNFNLRDNRNTNYEHKGKLGEGGEVTGATSPPQHSRS